MSTNRAMTLSSSGYTRMGELLVLVLLAAVLIGQIFFTPGDATWLETELVLLGGIIGIMVSCAKTPLHNWFMRRSRANAEWQWFREEVLAATESRSPESRDSQSQESKPADITRHAA